MHSVLINPVPLKQQDTTTIWRIMQCATVTSTARDSSVVAVVFVSVWVLLKHIKVIGDRVNFEFGPVIFLKTVYKLRL